MQQSVVAPDVIQKRNEWEKEISKTDADKLVFLDESGVNIDMTRHYGRAIAKERVVDHAPENTPTSTTILSSIRFDGSRCTCCIFHHTVRILTLLRKCGRKSKPFYES